MSTFDYQATVQRIMGLYRDRGLERTESDVVKYAKAIGQRLNLSTLKALEAIEDDLLSTPPPKHKD